MFIWGLQGATIKCILMVTFALCFDECKSDQNTILFLQNLPYPSPTRAARVLY